MYACNWMAVYWSGFPFLYCWLTPLVWPVYDGWYQLINVVIIGFLIVLGMRQRWGQFFLAACLLLLVTGIPQFANILFRLGGSCG